MHELAVVRGILDIALRHAESEGAARIVSVGVTVGGLRGFVVQWMQRYFDQLSRGTIADGACLRIHEARVAFRCACGEEFPVTREGLRAPVCPRCGRSDSRLVSGNELFIDNVEVM